MNVCRAIQTTQATPSREVPELDDISRQKWIQMRESD
jgi:hypothetical protein